MFPRLDIPVLGWHWADSYDPGYASFTAMCLVDAFYGNPILYTFIGLMRESAIQQFQQSNMTEKKQQHRAAREQWRLLVTLANNPTLIEDRKHNLLNRIVQKAPSRRSARFKFIMTVTKDIVMCVAGFIGFVAFLFFTDPASNIGYAILTSLCAISLIVASIADLIAQIRQRRQRKKIARSLEE
jgi:hypothetical protein